MKAVIYARVSDPKIQDAEDKVSIDQQLADQRSLCERNGWRVIGEFVDRESYRATQNPKRGKVINPNCIARTTACFGPLPAQHGCAQAAGFTSVSAPSRLAPSTSSTRPPPTSPVSRAARGRKTAKTGPSNA